MSNFTKFDIWTTRPDDNLKSLIDVLRPNKYVQSSLDEACKGVVDRLSNEGSELATVLNEAAPSSATDKSIVHMYETLNNEYSAQGGFYLQGKSAIYDEFGTGEEGASDPHPMKDYFPLNPYNSGPYIFYNEFAGRYQWYYKPMAGMPYFTETGATSGIPSGKQMYTAAQHVRKIKGNIIAEEINDAIRILTK